MNEWIVLAAAIALAYAGAGLGATIRHGVSRRG